MANREQRGGREKQKPKKDKSKEVAATTSYAAQFGKGASKKK